MSPGTRRAAVRRRVVGVVLLAVLGAAGVRQVAAQDADGSTGRTLGGAALGLYSGGVLSWVGGLLPCDRTLLGVRCVSAVGGAGALVGLVTGAVIGDQDGDQLRARARGAGYGTLIGVGVGLVLHQAVRQYTWNDALLVAAFGAAVGAAPRGTLVGTGFGGAVGGLAWAFSSRGGVQDLIMFTVVGGVLGGMLDWGAGALEAGGAGAAGPAVTSSISIPWG